MPTFAFSESFGSSLEDALEGGFGNEFGMLPMSHVWQPEAPLCILGSAAEVTKLTFANCRLTLAIKEW